MKLRTLAIALVAIGVLAFPTGALAGKAKDKERVTAMTRNVYLGADLNPAVEANSVEEAIDAAGVIWNEVVRTNFPERSVPLAKEIRRAKPDLVGLQEVALWTTQTPSDIGGPPINPSGQEASDVAYDFLALLMARLGNKYRVAGVQEEFEAELPANTDGNDATGGFGGADMDVRLQMRDVILARKGTKTKKLEMAHYETLFVADVGGVEVPADRGWLSVMANVDGAKLKFVNTHLEAFGDPKIREAQAEELEDAALKGKKQIVLVGDLNSGLRKPHKITGQDQLAFKSLDKFGMVDRGAVQSCCYESTLNDPSEKFDHTVDHVLVKPRAKSRDAFITGNDRSEMTPSGLWPSDHGGVVSELLLG